MKRVYSWINAFVCVFVIVMIFVAFSNSMPDGNTYVKNYDMSDGWKYEDGEAVNLTDLRLDEDIVAISRTLTSNEASGAALCFQTSNLFMYIRLDDDTIYDFHPKLSAMEGRFYGDLIHFVNIPFFEGEKTITIEYHSLIDTSYTSFRDIKLQSPREYEYDILKANLPKFLTCTVVVIFGMFIVMFGIIFDKDVIHRAETTSLGAFAIIMGVWTNSGSMVIQSLTDDSSYARLLDYTALMFLPVPILIFMAAFTGAFDSWLFRISVTLPLINTAFIFTAVLLGLFDYHELLFMIHIMLIYGVAICITMLIKGKKRIGRHYSRILIIAFILLFAAGAVDLVRYYIYRDSDVAKFSRIGIAMFITVFAVYELRQLFDLTRKGMELEVMEKLAHTDGLTGLLNRNALEELEDQIKKTNEGSYVFVQLDINGLKSINDTYGHSSGDAHIMAAADIITESFMGSRVFRMGGDEFLIIIEGKDCLSQYDKGIKAMTELEEEYNKTVDSEDKRLQIAYGYSEYDCSAHDPEEAEKVADMRMYECKTKMKAAGANA